MTRTKPLLPVACPEVVLPLPALWELQAQPLGAEGCPPDTKAQIIIQWLKFKNFLLKLLASPRSGFRHVTSTLLHPPLAAGSAVWVARTDRDGHCSPARVAKWCCNTNKDLLLGSCLKLMGWRGTEGLSKAFGETLGQPLPILDPSFSICESWGRDADFMWTSLQAKC